ncbi:adenylosuccinate synthase [Pontibacillus yanchengensis]|uniref:Adenylosuccinate synthetase n=1 Tax=Pontibacillus yanchengensis Y32 TaxID=1385514 RepID=A0A0A2TGG5_9BACI|nr:adenylosuccinate synthase [Pontibacillus yanchengensis]KGP73201.1 adenylosuccinate synthetase [Pontibacillus yanchengensis Y32]
MSSVVVVGTQWGDEGKGKITDFLSQQANVVARYQGGDNAGHTIQFEGETYKLHLIPSGIFYDDKQCVMGNGMVINPKALLKELTYLHDRNISTDNLRISNRAQVILPYHIKLDELQEAQKGDQKIGTTKKGIGPAYMDKAARVGIRIADLLDADTFRERLQQNVAEKNLYFKHIYNDEVMSAEEIFEEYYSYGQQLAKYVCDASKVLNDAIDADEPVLFEGAQGVMLDIDQGTYPFVTSSNPTAGGVTVGAGVGPTKIHHVMGVSKAYTTRVGDGPFPTELHGEVGNQIREVGREYGTTTGRPRRVGWFDTVVVRHARRVSGITALSLNSIDVLTGIETLKICTAYMYNGELLEEFPANLNELAKCEPVYEEMPGWTEDITDVRNFEDLPENAQHYVKRASELTGIPLAVFSVGPDRSQTNVMIDIYQTKSV